MRKCNALPITALACLGLVAATHASAGDWVMTISPDGDAPRLITISPESGVMTTSPPPHSAGLPGRAIVQSAMASQVERSEAQTARKVMDYRMYRRVYASIPFSRTEYNANPGYRHEATMELMIGQLRPRYVFPWMGSPVAHHTRGSSHGRGIGLLGGFHAFGPGLFSSATPAIMRNGVQMPVMPPPNGINTLNPIPPGITTAPAGP